MPDFSRIKLPDNTILNIKDVVSGYIGSLAVYIEYSNGAYHVINSGLTFADIETAINKNYFVYVEDVTHSDSPVSNVYYTNIYTYTKYRYDATSLYDYLYFEQYGDGKIKTFEIRDDLTVTLYQDTVKNVDTFVVTFTSGAGNTYTADKTYDEIVAAYNAGAYVYGYYPTFKRLYMLTLVDTSAYTVYFESYISEDTHGTYGIECFSVSYINDADVISHSIERPWSSPVTFTYNGATATFTADKGLQELEYDYENNKYIYGIYMEGVYALTYYNAQAREMCFERYSSREGAIEVFTLDSSSVSYSLEPIGGGGSGDTSIYVTDTTLHILSNIQSGDGVQY